MMKINRSAIKHSLKKILPKPLFKLVQFAWSVFGLKVTQIIDARRLLKFKKTEVAKLAHNGRNFSLYLSPANGFIDRHIFLYGVYEPFILDLIDKHLLEGMTFIDIGANIGQHSMYAAKLVGENGAVYSYEPIPHIYEQLMKSSEINNFKHIVHAKNYALGANEKEELLNISKNAGGSSLVNRDDTHEIIKVTIKKGDDELLSLKRIDLIKIDVEGYEYEVLIGMEKTLEKFRPNILIEFSGQFYKKQNNGHGMKILELLQKYGYLLYDIEENMTEVDDLAKFDKEISEKRSQTNLLCIARKGDEI